MGMKFRYNNEHKIKSALVHYFRVFGTDSHVRYPIAALQQGVEPLELSTYMEEQGLGYPQNRDEAIVALKKLSKI